MRLRILTALVALVATFGSLGCASYTETIRDAQVDLATGRPASALEVINDHLDVDDSNALPENLKKNRILLLLERGTLLQAIGDYEGSARDLMIADQRLDWLDIDGAGSVDLAKYLYSGSATPYRAPPYERLLLNTLNMINFMVLRDYQGARVEARRFQIIAQFMVDEAGTPVAPELLAAGNYLGGAAFESSREYDVAVRYYARAWLYGHQTDELRQRLVDLIRVTSWDGAGFTTLDQELAEMIEAAKSKGALRPREYRRSHVDGQLLTVVQTGVVPYKVAERLPIGAALTYHSHYGHHHHLSAAQHAEAQRLALSGALKWVNFPMLSFEGLPRRRSNISVAIDGGATDVAQLSDVSTQVEAAYRQVAGALIGTAITRMIARAAVGGATRAGSRAVAQSQDQPAIGVLGYVAGLALEGALVATDVPDTRSWTTAPGAIWISRSRTTPGMHEIKVAIDGSTESRYVTTKQGSLTVMNFSRRR